VLEHEDLITKARQDAQKIVGSDPSLLHHPHLAHAIDAYLNPEKEAFLERG
jgi:ATP-dependent DNA helicase RecG